MLNFTDFPAMMALGNAHEEYEHKKDKKQDRFRSSDNSDDEEKKDVIVGNIYRMNLPKFIITMDGYLRLGMVNQHKDLLIGDDQCIGGGYYQFDWASNRLLLDRASYDFGRPRWHLLNTLKVSASYRGLRIIYLYDDDHEDYIVSDELQIEYYE